MFTPDQLPEIAADLKATGLSLDPSQLTDLTEFPMGAVISLGGCTASFVSPEGLVVTNHHCARGSIQFNSTEENNYLEDGFLAATKADELPAAPGSRVYVTVEVSDVTEEITADLADDLSGRERFDAIDAKQKAMIADCEADGGYRCQAVSFFGGLQYKLIKRLEIKDVRLVYGPRDDIGLFGGDIDNWVWPRHTGDFAFYRAYVAPDGTPADYAEENVPFRPEHHLKVSASGLDDGDFVMAAGYPGSTSRYARLAEVENTFDWFYPTYVEVIGEWVATIEEAAPEGSDARIKYESRLAGLNNVLKNFQGQIEGARRVGLVDRRAAREAELNAWIADADDGSGAADAITALDALAEEGATENQRNFWYNNATRPQLLATAQQLYRWALEREKPDEERERGFQDRDETFFKQSLERLDRRYDADVDRAEWLLFLGYYLDADPSLRVAAFDDALGLSEDTDASDLDAILAPYYEDGELTDSDKRLAWMTMAAEDFENSDDLFIKLAVALYATELAQEDASKDRSGRSAALRPQYMQAIIDWQQSNDYVAYPDANSTLRVTYGNVTGGSPRDGLIYEPFTRLEGLLEKHTGEWPFNVPEEQSALIEAEDYGDYALEGLGSVPVNFLSDLDSTGGNSGSATLNAEGELVGLLFDGTFESVNSDWDFDPRTTRTIHVDTRYMLWVMEKVDDAGHLIGEMDIVD
ncbi:MAG: S46 family peptidase [Pseudomonadota bacterium]